MLTTDRLNQLSATEIARRIARGETTAEAAMRDCLARIEAREATVRAWAFIDRAAALAQARACDKATTRGALHGVPVGIKDVLDTADMPTGMGSSIYDGYRPKTDASCVALLRAAGGIVLGKTVTCEFAGMEPGTTTNPHNPAHTPGGSSSGSGAAVADFMVPVALGTQTGGSVLRPASFCGVVGYKPSFGTINRAGLKFAAESLDTIGLLARTVEDVGLVTAVLAGKPAEPPPALDRAPRIGFCRTPLWGTVQPASATAVEDAARRLAAAGATVRDVALPDGFDRLGPSRDAINDYERAHAMAHEWRTAPDAISPRLSASIRRGLDLPYARYAEAIRCAETCRGRLGAVFDGLDVLLAPCVPGEAPAGLESTGDPKLQGLWTILHVPTIALPTHRGPNGLPVGTQLVGPAHGDEILLAAARWVFEKLGAQG